MKIALVAHGDNPPYLKELFNGEGFELVEKECNNEKEYIDLLNSKPHKLEILDLTGGRHDVVTDQPIHSLCW